MAKKTTLRSAKRFGTRYGKRNKEKVAVLEREHRGKRKCPFCNYVKVKRLSKGIWECDKCNSKFAGKAYTITAPKKSSGEVKTKIQRAREMVIEEVQEEEILQDEAVKESAESEDTPKTSEKPVESDIPEELRVA